MNLVSGASLGLDTCKIFAILKGMALKIIEYGSPEYEQMLALRDNILRKPLGLRFDPVDLENENHDILIGAFEEDDILGCCMLIEENPSIVRLRQMAVYNEKQGKGIGRALMNFAENVARDRGYKLLNLSLIHI